MHIVYGNSAQIRKILAYQPYGIAFIKPESRVECAGSKIKCSGCQQQQMQFLRGIMVQQCSVSLHFFRFSIREICD